MIHVHQTMYGVPVDTRSDDFKDTYQNIRSYPPSLIMETQYWLDKIINEEIKNDIRSDRQLLGPCHATERLQRAQIVLQNKLMPKWTQINKDLSNVIAKPLCTHKQIIELIERVNLLLSMKELANGAYYLAYDNDTAINIVTVNSQS